MGSSLSSYFYYSKNDNCDENYRPLPGNPLSCFSGQSFPTITNKQPNNQPTNQPNKQTNKLLKPPLPYRMEEFLNYWGKNNSFEAVYT